MPPKGWKRDPVTRQYKAPGKTPGARAMEAAPVVWRCDAGHQVTGLPYCPTCRSAGDDGSAAPRREFKGGVRETLDGMLTLLEPLPHARQVQAIAAAICMLDTKAAAAALSSFQLSTSTAARSAVEQ